MWVLLIVSDVTIYGAAISQSASRLIPTKLIEQKKICSNRSLSLCGVVREYNQDIASSVQLQQEFLQLTSKVVVSQVSAFMSPTAQEMWN